MLKSVQVIRDFEDIIQQTRSLLIFQLENQVYAFNIEQVAQIIPMIRLTPLPQMEHVIEGIANIHGTIVPVISARRHLGLPEQLPQLYTPIILARVGDRPLGMIVDQVLDVIVVPSERIVSPGDILPEGMENSPIMCGVVYHNERSILLLDPQHLLRPNQMKMLNWAMSNIAKSAPGKPAFPQAMQGPSDWDQPPAMPAVAPDRVAFETVRAALSEKLVPPSQTNGKAQPVTEQTEPVEQEAELEAPKAESEVLEAKADVQQPEPAVAEVSPAAQPEAQTAPVDAQPETTAPDVIPGTAETIDNAQAQPEPKKAAKKGKRKGPIIPKTAVDRGAEIRKQRRNMGAVLLQQFTGLALDVVSPDGERDEDTTQDDELNA